MAPSSTYAHMLEAVRRKVDSGYSAESAHVSVARDWQLADTDDSCQLLEDALDYQTVTYGIEY